ncbi:UNVERIFIED_CONTAM: Pentatricopeptide repeat-containing protein [Sesamum calycinum]|uniref:Pentatricopeptide repeat-containing protein n=1 Tax=Sesamum calycinum TaxID=2727403 RepID=A0AAW2LZ79_9LAMI
MVGASVLNQPQQFLIAHDHHSKIPDIDITLKEQECISLIKRCTNMEEFKRVHAQILKLGFFCSSFCASNLIATCALSQWGSMDYACSIFQQIDDPASFEFNAMIRGHVKEFNSEAALCTYLDMLEIHGQVLKLGFVEDVFVQNSLINMYGKCGQIERSCAVFEQMDRKTVASWSAVIAAHANLGMWDECLSLFGEMNCEGCWRAEESTLRTARRNHKSYTVVVSGLANHGRGEEALNVFEQMLGEGFKPDDVVYVGVLSACSHAGLVEKGMRCFDRMRFEHGIEPTIQHYGCMVDLMGRAGMINEAFELIKSMPMTPNDVIWRSLLSSCKVHQNVELGEIAAGLLFQLKTQNAGDYLMLSNIYAEAGRWQDVSMTRVKMACTGLSQVPGSSSVEVKRKVHKFLSNDKSHPQCYEIYDASPNGVAVEIRGLLSRYITGSARCG